MANQIYTLYINKSRDDNVSANIGVERYNDYFLDTQGILYTYLRQYTEANKPQCNENKCAMGRMSA